MLFEAYTKAPESMIGSTNASVNRVLIRKSQRISAYRLVAVLSRPEKCVFSNVRLLLLSQRWSQSAWISSHAGGKEGEREGGRGEREREGVSLHNSLSLLFTSPPSLSPSLPPS